MHYRFLVRAMGDPKNSYPVVLDLQFAVFRIRLQGLRPNVSFHPDRISSLEVPTLFH
jgi:hypothetical protein